MHPVAVSTDNFTVLSYDVYTEFLKKLVNHRLEERVVGMIRQLDMLPHDIVVNRELDKFYYMQKLAEMKVLDDQLYQALERVSVMMTGRYERRKEVMLRWKKDRRWLAVREREFDAIDD